MNEKTPGPQGPSPNKTNSEKPTLSYDGQDDDTIQEASSARGPVTHLPHLNRFTLIHLLGSGGMGQVYEAYDPRLKRHLAVKLMLHQGYLQRSRFAEEARLQARVDHPNVCKVYEVGEEDGKAYIAMQLIRGRTPAAMLPILSRRERIQILASVAEGVHEAHRMGLIHRDLKPNNIMIEETEDGGRRAYVLDFGIARPLEGSELTRTGAFLGTPQYTAPEQALGKTDVTHACDTYSLGATLYYLLAERPPFAGQSFGSLMADLQKSGPTPLVMLDPNLPRDLISICNKAMALDPAERYDTARAFAEDLHRFLDHKPILAKPPSPAARLIKAIRRNKLLSGVLAAALLILLGSLIYGELAQRRAERREALVWRYTQRVERINALHRQIMLARPHDTRPGLALFRQEMARIQDELANAKAVARIPAMEALGRAHFILGEYEEARRYLQSVWDSGQGSGQTAYTLGLTLARLYEQRSRTEMIRAGMVNSDSQMASAGLFKSGSMKADVLARLQRQLQEPALRLLELCRTEPLNDPQLLEAEIADTRGDYQRVIDVLEPRAKDRPWVYEMDVLRGNALRQLSHQAGDKGEEEAAASYRTQALAAYDRALASAGSDATIYLAKAELFHYFAATGGLSPEAADGMIDQALGETDKALAVDPDSSRALFLALKLHLTLAKGFINRGKTAGDRVDAALAAAQRLAEALPEQDRDPIVSADIHYTRARLLTARKASPLQELEAGVDELKRTPAEDRDAYYFAISGFVHLERAKLTRRPEDEDQAIQALLGALRLEPDSLYHINNLGLIYLNRGQRLSGTEQTASLSEAARYFDHASQLGPDNYLPAFYQGMIYKAMGAAALNSGGDPRPHLEKAIEHFARGAQLRPGMFQFPLGEASANILLGQTMFERGSDWRAPLKKCYALLAQAAEAAPDVGLIYQNRAIAYQMEGFYLCRTGQNPAEVLDKCVADIRHARQLGDQAFFPYLHAQSELVRAEWALQSDGDMEPHLERAGQLLDEAAAMDPGFTSLWRGRGFAHLLRARALERAGKDPRDQYQEALTAFAQEDEDLQSQLETATAAVYAARYLTHCCPGETAAVLTSGIEHIEAVLQQNPALAEARAIQAILRQLAEPSKSAETNRQLQDALRDNPHLAYRWGEILP